MPSRVGGIDDAIWSQNEGLAGASAPSGPTSRVEVIFEEPKPQRRWTIALRIFLAFPHLLVLVVLEIFSLGAVLLGWFAALATGRFPEGFSALLRGVIRYATRLFAYVYLLIDTYPPLSLEDEEESKDTYPVRVFVPRGPVRRLTVLFRIILVIPTYLVTSFAWAGLIVVSPVLWVIVLTSGQMPRVAFDAVASILRYEARYFSYLSMVTDSYPVGIFGDGTFAYQDVIASEATPPVLSTESEGSPGVTESEQALRQALTATTTRPALMLSRETRHLVAVILVVGAFGTAANYAYEAHRISTTPTQFPNGGQAEVQTAVSTAIEDSLQQLADAHAVLTSSLATAGRAAGSCDGQLACLTGNQGKIAEAFSAFLAKLDSVAYALGGLQLTQLSSVTSRMISLDRQLASTSDVSTYNTQVQTLPNLFSQFDTSYTALINSYIG